MVNPNNTTTPPMHPARPFPQVAKNADSKSKYILYTFPSREAAAHAEILLLDLENLQETSTITTITAKYFKIEHI